ncbi:hypothetical protein H6A18_00945 [Collinsella tanakaei]|uniref:hypothetical protein n=1 Tax=Collinsella tanakaei TaxID=626935 RepID=UPI0019566D76|nr:hypothetical protein [Collinsella tanakaei]MBM6755106.1 hypothetical protein [Collinsella tanakaei]
MFGSLSREAVEFQAELNEAVRAQNEAWLDAPSSTEAEERSKAYLRESNVLFDEMLTAPDDRAFYEAEACYERFEADHAAGAGRMAGTDAAGSELRARFMERLVELGDPAVYTSTAQMPALVMLAARWQENLAVPGARQLGTLLSTAPANQVEALGPLAPEAYCMALLPMAIVAVRTVSWRSRERLLAVAPISGGAASAVTIVAATLLSLAALGVTMAPAVIWLAVVNGVGDPSYPVAFFWARTPVLTDAGAIVAQAVVLYMLVALVLACAAELTVQLTHHVAPAVVAVAAIAAVPLAPEYFETWSPLADIAPWLPSSYFAVPLATGSLGYFINAENVAIPLAGMSVVRGATVLGITAGACVFALALVYGVRTIRRLRAHSGWGDFRGTGTPRGGVFASGSSDPADAPAGKHARMRATSDPVSEYGGRSATLSEYTSSLVAASRGVPLSCVTAALVLMSIAPVVFGFASGMAVFERPWYEERLRVLQADYAERASAMSIEERQAAEQQVAFCREVVYSRDAGAFVDAAIAYETWCAEGAPAGSSAQGSVQGEGSPAMRASFFRMLRACGDVRLFSTAADMPGIPYLAFLSRVIPLAVWAAPSCVMAVRIAVRMRAGLLRGAPVRLRMRLFAHISLSIAFGVIVDALALTGALLIAGTANGWGVLSYPHVASMAGEILTASAAIGRHLVTTMFANALVSCCVAAAAAVLCRDRRPRRVPAARFIAYR